MNDEKESKSTSWLLTGNMVMLMVVVGCSYHTTAMDQLVLINHSRKSGAVVNNELTS